MTKLGGVLILGTCFLLLVFGAMNRSVANPAKADELLELFQKPRIADSFGVEAKEENYSNDDEARALSIPRALFSDLNKYPLVGELDIETNKSYGLALGAYDAASTGGIDGWNYDIPFSMPIVVWNSGRLNSRKVNQDDYLIELNRYSNSEILRYLVIDKTAYVVLRLADKSEFQILELAWSDRQLPYFSGYYFQISSDPIPNTREVVFSSEFLKKLQAKLLAD